MTDRIDKALALARDLQRMTLHGPPPLATTMEIAAGLVDAGGEIERLTAERDAARLEARAYGNALAREKNQDERIRRVKAIREETGCGLKEALDIVNGSPTVVAVVGLTLVQEVDRLATALATAKNEERAAFSAYAHQRAAEWQSVGAQYVADVVREYGDFVEAGRHREKA